MNETLNPQEGNRIPIELNDVLQAALERLKQQAEAPLTYEERSQYQQELEVGQHRLAASVGSLYEKCREEGVLVTGRHVNEAELNSLPKDYFGAIFFADDLVVRAKFIPSSDPGELHGFTLEVLPKVDNMEEIMMDEGSANARPKCGIWGVVIKNDDGTYSRFGIESRPSVSDWLPADKQDYEQRRATQDAFFAIIDACAASIE